MACAGVPEKKDDWELQSRELRGTKDERSLNDPDAKLKPAQKSEFISVSTFHYPHSTFNHLAPYPEP
jgi:hypothetical protein